ncbi:hypothetical protein [Aquimarina sp. 2201CG14-23]|uniref:hypothetical protein n=1 Tax=Aquimarina mycalae TaxID=3040073 RepID=UPI0024782910|nr:hypothetical protein [Aquimarina sp. 2201CG14-23]MDH7444630.1 hypothetical protein [Aquimarina sp. 2201CG14-23]
MKKKITLYIAVFCLFIVGNTYAQNTENANASLVESQERFITLNQLESNTSAQIARENMVGNNAVFIQQIGTGNQVFSTITAQTSDIRLNQNGEQNLIDINETSREIEKFITQNGNNNTVTDFSFNPDVSTSLEILQEGDNLSFERFGSNELTKNLKFKMTGNARTIIVRSF